MTEYDEVAHNMTPPRFTTFDAAARWVRSQMPGETATVTDNVAQSLYESQTPETSRAVTVRYPEIGIGVDIVIPAGTELIRVGSEYAVKSEALLITLTGNAHDPKYRNCIVPVDAVKTFRLFG